MCQVPLGWMSQRPKSGVCQSQNVLIVSNLVSADSLPFPPFPLKNKYLYIGLFYYITKQRLQISRITFNKTVYEPRYDEQWIHLDTLTCLESMCQVPLCWMSQHPKKWSLSITKCLNCFKFSFGRFSSFPSFPLKNKYL